MSRHFIRHYLEMVAAMFLGMAVLGMPAEAALRAIGSSSAELTTQAPALMLLEMAFTMTVPMVGWMLFRGHGWPASLEMAASMLLPTAVLMGLLAAGIVEGIGVLLVLEHVAMVVCMLAAMLLRRDEYSHAHGRAHEEVTA